MSIRKLALVLLLPLAAACTKISDRAAPPATTLQSASTHPDQSPVLADNTVLHANVPYGGPDAELDVADIYSPRDTANAPVVIYVHGGEWSRGDKHEIAFKPRLLNTNGIVLMAINYRLSPKSPHPAQADDVATAVAFMHDHAREYGGNPGKIILMGHSAGCHLVTLVGLDPEFLAKRNLKPTDIRGVVAWSGGMYDLVDRYKAGGMYHSYIEATFGPTPEAQRAGSPIAYVQNAAKSPAFLFISADDEKSKSARAAADDIARQIQSNGGKAQQALLAGKTHFTSDYDLGAPGDQTSAILLKFIEQTTKEACDD